MKKKRTVLEHKIVVNHDTATNEFFINISSLDLDLSGSNILETSGEKAVLKYRLDDANGVDFYETFVPKSARGRGLAEALVDSALTWATHSNFEQRASCWYVQKHLSSQL
jgi:predicted GNAT family acetyltransferase